jgi:hypothetical protein
MLTMRRKVKNFSAGGIILRSKKFEKSAELEQIFEEYGIKNVILGRIKCLLPECSGCCTGKCYNSFKNGPNNVKLATLVRTCDSCSVRLLVVLGYKMSKKKFNLDFF